MKNQPTLVHSRKKGKNQRRSKGRRAVHRKPVRNPADIP
jgi:hypothetical protein